MVRVLGVVAAVGIVLAVIGYYCGWFRMETRDTHGHDTVILSVDKDKINQDKADAQQHVRDLEQK